MDARDNTLGISWHDSACIPNLNPGNVMDYFSERSNPFYDRTCNNEVVKMQRLNLEQLNNMTGCEYILLHCQEPILYVIRKQHRHSPTQVTPLADYYIIAGVVYQAPDIGSVINSRILSAVHHIQGAFDKTQSFSRYQPSKGYWWDFKSHEGSDAKKPKDKSKEEPSSMFQRQRVDMLLVELAKKYPPKIAATVAAVTSSANATAATATAVSATTNATEKLSQSDGDPPARTSQPQVSPQQQQQQQQQVPQQPTAQQQQQPQQQPPLQATSLSSLVEPKVEIKQEKMTDETSGSSLTASSQVVGVANKSLSSPSSSSSSSIKPPAEKRPRSMV